MHVQVYSKADLVAEMDVDLAAKTVSQYKCYTSDPLHMPFGINVTPTYAAFLDFLESRCPPRDRTNIKHLLDNWGLIEYDPLAITRITHGLMFADYLWIRFDNEEITYDQIKVRD